MGDALKQRLHWRDRVQNAQRTQRADQLQVHLARADLARRDLELKRAEPFQQKQDSSLLVRQIASIQKWLTAKVLFMLLL